MIAGTELDKLIAEKVMGMSHVPKKCDYTGYYHFCGVCNPEPYSSEMNSVWKVVDRLREEGHDFAMSSHNQDGHTNWYVRITCKPELYYIVQGDHLSAAQAICLCALEACTALV